MMITQSLQAMSKRCMLLLLQLLLLRRCAKG